MMQIGLRAETRNKKQNKCKIKSIEWLYLAAKGHRRALIDLNGSKKFTWLIP